MFCFYLNVSAQYACSALRGQKRVSGPQELELQMAVNYHVGDGTWILALCKSNTFSQLLSHLSSPLNDTF